MSSYFIKRKTLQQLYVLCLIILFVFLGSVRVIARNIKIGLFQDKNIYSVVFSIVEGSYQIRCDGNILSKVLPGEIFYLSADNNKIHFGNGDHKFDSYAMLEIEATESNSVFQLKPVSPLLQSADYDGDLSISVINNKLQLINLVELDNYIAGVIEAEGGANALPEYYKAQAILIRTYAIKNMYRHASDGYNLCSSEHCQAYKGRSLLNRQIFEATRSTDGLVLTDKTGALIVAPYHSNCGGKTCTADFAWQTELPYLQSVADPFCASGRNFGWTKQIDLARWIKYLESNGLNTNGISSNSYVVKSSIRQKYFSLKSINIPMRKIREDFDLKSSFFDTEIGGSDLVFKGKGFGHGVGLCQEGAMEMAKVGYTYVDILHFYFQGILIASWNYTEQEIQNEQ